VESEPAAEVEEEELTKPLNQIWECSLPYGDFIKSMVSLFLHRLRPSITTPDLPSATTHLFFPCPGMLTVMRFSMQIWVFFQ
jgi:hypothetical protein